MKSHGYAAYDKKSPLVPFRFERRDPGPNDVVVEIAYCGICHSDIHQVRDEWGGSIYPMVPGHEIVGHVTAVGGAVKKFKVGDPAAVGVIVDSDRVCENCKAGEEQYCIKGAVETYNKLDYSGNPMYGGYSNNIVADERFVHTISPKLNPAAVAPSVVRRNYDVLAAAALEGGQGQQGRGRWAGWIGAYGVEVCSFLWRARGAVHDVCRQD